MTLKDKAAKGLAWDLGGTFVGNGSALIVSIVLARLLEPSQFGIVAMGLVFIAITQVFVDAGFSSALIQKKNNTDLTYSSVFWLNVFTGVTLSLLFIVVAPLIGRFFEIDEVTELVQWLSLSFIPFSLSNVQAAILRKQLDFKTLTIRGIIGSTLGGVIGITCAYLNFGSFSLVIQHLASAFISAAFLWSATDWRPGFKFSMAELSHLTLFSSYVFLDSVLSRFFEKIDTLFIGKVFSASTLGYYSRAESLNAQVSTYTSSSLMRVFFPILSSIQDDEKRFNKVYFGIVGMTCFLSFLIAGVLFIGAKPIIVGLFGERWLYSVIIFKILAFKSFNVPLNTIMLNALLSRGKAKENFRISLVRRIIRVLPILIGLQFGLISFVWSVTAVSYLLTIYNAYFMERYLGINMLYHLRKIFEGIVPIVLLGVVSKYLSDELLTTAITLMVFLVFYITYARLIKMEGYILLKEELVTLIKRSNG